MRLILSVTFTVALKLKDADALHRDLMAISDPTHELYGRHLSIDEINFKYGPSSEDINLVIDYFQQIPGANVEANLHSDFILVRAPAKSIETHLETQLQWHTHVSSNEVKAMRAVRPLKIPDDVATLLSFTSLNSPVHKSTFSSDGRRRQAKQVKKDPDVRTIASDLPSNYLISYTNINIVGDTAKCTGDNNLDRNNFVSCQYFI